MTEVTQQHPALQLFDAGYEDLISIAPPKAKLAPHSMLRADALGKTPARRTKDGWVGFAGWSDHPTTRRDVERWIAGGASIGLRTRNFPFIDVDVEDAKLADDIAIALRQLFRVPLLQRFGRPPRFAIPFRTDEPFGKSKFTFLARDGTSQGGIQTSCHGAQCVVHGPHPSSGGDYFWMHWHFQSWCRATRRPVADLAARPLGQDLSNVTFTTYSCGSPRVAGWTLERSVRSRSRQASSVAQSTLRAPSLEARPDVRPLRRFRTTRSSTAGIPGCGNSLPSRPLAVRTTRRKRSRLRSTGQPLGPVKTIQSTCERPGKVYTPPSPWDGVSLTNKRASTDSTPRSTSSMRLAKRRPIPHQSTRALRESPWTRCTSVKPSLRMVRSQRPRPSGLPLCMAIRFAPSSWRCLNCRMVSCLHVGTACRRQRRRMILSRRPSAALCYRRRSDWELTPDEPRRYDVVLQAELEQGEHPQWVSASSEDRWLLRRAAFALFTNLPGLTSRANDGPGDELSLINVARDELVSGLIPAKAVAAFVGLPGQGKTFLAIELAARVAKQPEQGEVTQRPAPEKFGGREVQHGSVLYFTSEDADGNRSRLSRGRGERRGPADLHSFGRVPPLSALDRTIVFMLEALRRALTEDSPPLKLIVIDVLRAAIEGEENSSDVVSPAMVAASVIGRMTGATVLLVHHAALSAPGLVGEARPHLPQPWTLLAP